MEFSKILQDLKARKLHPFYLLHGNESYFIDLISDYIEEYVLEEAQKGFDQTILYGKDTDLVTIVNAARRYPMIADYQVILVKEAQSLDWKVGEDALVKYLENPMPQTILVFGFKHGMFDRRKKVYKAAQKVGVVMEAKKIFDNKVAQWVTTYLRERGRKIHPQAAALIGEYLGADLSKVVNELEKLLLNVPSTEEISSKHIERFIGISKDFNVFELSNALARKDALKAYQIVSYFAANPKNHPFPLTMAALGSFFTRALKYHYLPDKSPQTVAKSLGINPFFAREYEMTARNYGRMTLFEVVGQLNQYDLKFKGVGVGDVRQADLLKEMIFKILNTR